MSPPTDSILYHWWAPVPRRIRLDKVRVSNATRRPVNTLSKAGITLRDCHCSLSALVSMASITSRVARASTREPRLALSSISPNHLKARQNWLEDCEADCGPVATWAQNCVTATCAEQCTADLLQSLSRCRVCVQDKNAVAVATADEYRSAIEQACIGGASPGVDDTGDSFSDAELPSQPSSASTASLTVSNHATSSHQASDELSRSTLQLLTPSASQFLPPTPTVAQWSSVSPPRPHSEPITATETRSNTYQGQQSLESSTLGDTSIQSNSVVSQNPASASPAVVESASLGSKVIVGIAVGGAAAILIIAILLCLLWRSQRVKRRSSAS